MKINFKRIKTIAMLAIIVLQTIVTAVPVHAITTADVRYDSTHRRNMNVTFNGENRDVTVSPIYLNRGSGEELVFCVDPFTLVLQGPGYSSNPFTLNRKANLVSSLWRQAGTDWDTYFVAQEMMYEETGSEVHSNGNLSPVQRQTIKDRINQVITNYERKASFDEETFKVNLGESIILEDTNGLDLAQFDTLVENSANVDYSIQGNKLTITPKADSKESGILLLEKSLQRGTPFIWKKLNSQDLASAGVSDPNDLLVRLNVEKTGEVKITKLDKGTGEVVPNTEFDVTFDGKTQEVKTDGNGEAVVKGIFHDTKVTVTETFVPAPYILDENNTKEVIIRAGKTSSVEFRNERATGKTTLTKRDKTTESDKPLNPNYPMIGAKYGLFKEDDTLIKEFELDETLTATIDHLELGIYYWKETVAPVGYTLDPTEHIVELTYKDQFTPVVVDDARSDNDVIRMNLDGQKVIQNDTNEMFKNGVEFTMTNQRTGEEFVVTSANVDGKAGYFRFEDLPLDDYILTETKGVDGYRLVDPMEIKYSYNKETESFTFTITDQKTGNLLHEDTLTQLELSEGINVDLGTYLLKNKAILDETPKEDEPTEESTPEEPELPKELPADKGSLPNTGEQMMKGATIVGLLLLLAVAGAMYLKRKKSSGSSEEKIEESN